MTIRCLLLLAFVALFIYTLSAFVNLRALQHQRDDALVFNLASRQRMLIQQMRLQVLGVQIGENVAYRETLENTADAYFERPGDGHHQPGRRRLHRGLPGTAGTAESGRRGHVCRQSRRT